MCGTIKGQVGRNSLIQLWFSDYTETFIMPFFQKRNFRSMKTFVSELLMIPSKNNRIDSFFNSDSFFGHFPSDNRENRNNFRDFY